MIRKLCGMMMRIVGNARILTHHENPVRNAISQGFVSILVTPWRAYSIVIGEAHAPKGLTALISVMPLKSPLYSVSKARIPWMTLVAAICASQ